MKDNVYNLPGLCAARLSTGDSPVYIRRGEFGYWPADNDQDVDGFNRALGITPQQRAAMLAGSLYGWHLPCADPSRYDSDGRPKCAA